MRRARALLPPLALLLAIVGTSAVGDIASADATGHITGKVTDANGLPLAGVSVGAFVRDDGLWTYATATLNADDGTYDLSGLGAGTYRIGFFEESEAYVSEYYDDATNLDRAVDVVVTAGGTSSGYDAQLDLGGHITGTVTNDASTPLENVVVTAYRDDGDGWEWVTDEDTASDGTYDIGDLGAGNYRLKFDDGSSRRYMTEFYDNAANIEAATDIAVTAGMTTAGRNVQLAAAPSVVSTAPPTITGTPKVGAPVTATPGTWTPAGTTTSYHWLVGGTPVTGATAATYTPAAADVGKTLQVEVSATKDGYTAATATSAAKTITKGTLKATKKPKVTGKAKKNATLTVSPGTWSPQAKATYQWYAGSKAIAKATAAKLKLTGKTLKAVAGKTISVVLTVTSPGYTTVTTRLKVPGRA